MTDNIEMARHAFRQWVRTLSPGTSSESPIAKRPVAVEPTNAIKCFIRHRQQWSKYESELAITETGPFRFAKDLWDELQE